MQSEKHNCLKPVRIDDDARGVALTFAGDNRFAQQQPSHSRGVRKGLVKALPMFTAREISQVRMSSIKDFADGFLAAHHVVQKHERRQ